MINKQSTLLLSVALSALILVTGHSAIAERPVSPMRTLDTPADRQAATPITAKLVPSGKGTRRLQLRYRGRILTGLDEVYSYIEPEDGQQYTIDEEFLFQRDCYVSPDGRWVYVERKGMRRVGLGYLYSVDRGRSRLVPFHITGRRLDEAAWAYLAHRGFTVSPYIPDGRIVRFNHWENNGRFLVLNVVGDDRSGQVINTDLRYTVGTATFARVP